MRAGPYPRRRSLLLSGPGIALIAIGFFIFMFGTVIAAVTGFIHPVIPPLIGFAFLVAGGMLITFDDPSRFSDVRYVRLRQDGAAVRLMCPGCGASLGETTSTRGVVRCDYCRTRVLVP